MPAELPAELRVLIASDPVGEGLFVAGAAFADKRRPYHYSIRASKALCFAGWSGRTYEQRFADPTELEAWMVSKGIGTLVIDRSVEGSRHWYAHMDQLEAIVAAEGARWDVHQSWDAVRGSVVYPGAVVAYRHRDWGQMLSLIHI